MDIQKIEATETPATIKVTLTDGAELWVPQPCETWHREFIDKWLADGGVIEPYVAPPPPPERTPQEKLQASGLTVDELKGLLGIA